MSQALAKDLDLKFRKLPSGASPGLLDWAELTSTLATQLKSSRSAAGADGSASALKGGDSSDAGTIQNLHPAVINIDRDTERDRDNVVASSGDIVSEDSEGDTAEEIRRHHRIARGISEGRHLAQICFLDNAETDTQASIWADFARKQVRQYG